jgi:hypothetical protein
VRKEELVNTFLNTLVNETLPDITAHYADKEHDRYSRQQLNQNAQPNTLLMIIDFAENMDTDGQFTVTQSAYFKTARSLFSCVR